MAGTRISTTVTSTVVLGSAGRPAPLRVLKSGDVAPALPGTDAVYAGRDPSLANLHITNLGTIAAAQGAAGVYNVADTPGGMGIDLRQSASLRNEGDISGGAGGRPAGPNGVSGAGGIGVYIAGSAVIHNGGTITGGFGGLAFTYGPVGGAGGIALDLRSGGTVFNSGLIGGGAGGPGALSGGGGVGIESQGRTEITNDGTITGGATDYGVTDSDAGAGIWLETGGSLVNHGLVEGGSSGVAEEASGNGGNAATFEAAFSTVTNTGSIVGGQGSNSNYVASSSSGGDGVAFLASGGLWNAGLISGGGGASGRFGGGPGGNGVVLGAGGAVHNHGRILGGVGGNGGPSMDGPSPSGNGGIGVVLSGYVNFYNGGLIAGGQGGGAGAVFTQGGLGGDGIDAVTSSFLSNIGTIEGGTGGSAYVAGAGGTGVSLAGGSLGNEGTIHGGDSGDVVTAYGDNPAGAAGGIGVRLADGATLFNYGAIAGGTGQTGGGAGVYVNGGSLYTSGTISGGTCTIGGLGNAVSFGAVASTLILLPHARFEGLVSADPTAKDTLVLAGGDDTLSGIGIGLTGFAKVAVRSDANWTLRGTNLLGAAGLSIQGALANASTLQAATLVMQGGTLTNTHVGDISVGPNLYGATLDGITIASGAAITGFGVISAATLQDTGTLAAQGGTLALNANVNGFGTAIIDPGATLQTTGAFDANAIVFAAGGNEQLQMSDATPAGTISGFGAGDIIDLTTISANALNFDFGKLTLYNGKSVVAQMNMPRYVYDNSNFSLSPDQHGGTDVSFVSPTSSVAQFAATSHPFAGEHALGSAFAHPLLQQGLLF